MVLFEYNQYNPDDTVLWKTFLTILLIVISHRSVFALMPYADLFVLFGWKQSIPQTDKESQMMHFGLLSEKQMCSKHNSIFYFVITFQKFLFLIVIFHRK